MEWDPSTVSGIESFSTLWAGKEVSARPLVLPDSTRPKFYLPDEIGRRRRKQKGAERDRERLEFLCRRDSLQQYGSNETRFAAKKILATESGGSRTENEIMKKLLQPYSADDAMVTSLLQRVKEVLLKREKAAARLSPQKNPFGEEDKDDIFAESYEPDYPESSFDNLVTPRPPSGLPRGASRGSANRSFRRQSSTAEKAAIVAARRKEMEESYQKELDRRSSILDKRIQTAVSRAQSMRNEQYSVGELWTTALLAIKSIIQFKDIISSSRQLRVQDRERWRSAVVIQRRWRQSTKIDSMYKAADAVLKDNNEMGKAKTLAQDRAEACAVIVQFLTSLKGGLRSAVGGYIRKVKLLQRRFRAHRLHNDGRLFMLNVLYDKCFAAVQFQVSTNVLKRVNPAGTNSIGTVGSEKWKESYSSGSKNRILRDLMSPEIVQYMRDEILDPSRKELKKAFFSAVIVVDPACRQSVLYDLLLKCRWEETRSAAMKKKKMMLYEHMPVVTEKDARSFIRSGKDPLTLYMRSCDDALSMSETGDLESAISASTKKKRKLKYNTFLSHITATDMVDIIFESIFNTCEQANKYRLPTNTGSRASLMSDTRRKSRDVESSSGRRRSRGTERRTSKYSGVYGSSGSKEFDDASDCMSVCSSYSIRSRSSFLGVAVPPSSHRGSQRHVNKARKLSKK